MNKPNFLIKGITISMFIGLMLGFVLFRAGWLDLGKPNSTRPYSSTLALNSVGYEVDTPIVSDNLPQIDLDFFQTEPIDREELLKEHPLDSVIYQGRRMQRKDIFHFMASSKSLVVTSPPITVISYHDSLWRQKLDSSEIREIDLILGLGIVLDTIVQYKQPLTPPTTRFPSSDFISSSKSFLVLDPEDFLPYSFKRLGLPRPNSNHLYFVVDSLKLKWQHP